MVQESARVLIHFAVLLPAAHILDRHLFEARHLLSLLVSSSFLTCSSSAVIDITVRFPQCQPELTKTCCSTEWRKGGIWTHQTEWPSWEIECPLECGRLLVQTPTRFLYIKKW